MVNKPLENGWVWVDSNDRVAQVCEEITSQGVVAVDTEFRRRDTFFPQIALMQLATTGHCWLLDPLVISDVAPIRQLLLSPQRSEGATQRQRRSRGVCTLVGCDAGALGGYPESSRHAEPRFWPELQGTYRAVSGD